MSDHSSTHRAGEAPRKHFRSQDRCFFVNGSWYFATREGLDVGPYSSKEIAEAASVRLAAILAGVTDAKLARRLIECSLPLLDPWQEAV